MATLTIKKDGYEFELEVGADLDKAVNAIKRVFGEPCIPVLDPRKPRRDMTGATFGRWVVLYAARPYKNGAKRWLCRCRVCGTEKPIHSDSLIRGRSHTCNCPLGD